MNVNVFDSDNGLSQRVPLTTKTDCNEKRHEKVGIF